MQEVSGRVFRALFERFCRVGERAEEYCPGLRDWLCDLAQTRSNTGVFTQSSKFETEHLHHKNEAEWKNSAAFEHAKLVTGLTQARSQHARDFGDQCDAKSPVTFGELVETGARQRKQFNVRDCSG